MGIEANGQNIGTVDDRADKSLLFTLDTGEATVGHYDIQIGDNSPLIELVLDAQAPTREKEKEFGKIIYLRSGIGYWLANVPLVVSD